MACASSFTNVFWKEPVFSLTHFAGWRVLELNERFLGLEKLLSAEVKKGNARNALGERGDSAGLHSFWKEGCGKKGGTGWFLLLKDAAAQGCDSADHWVITVQANSWLSGHKNRLPPVCSFTMLAER